MFCLFLFVEGYELSAAMCSFQIGGAHTHSSSVFDYSLDALLSFALLLLCLCTFCFVFRTHHSADTFIVATATDATDAGLFSLEIFIIRSRSKFSILVSQSRTWNVRCTMCDVRALQLATCTLLLFISRCMCNWCWLLLLFTIYFMCFIIPLLLPLLLYKLQQSNQTNQKNASKHEQARKWEKFRDKNFLIIFLYLYI